jgi:hypothetical protein
LLPSATTQGASAFHETTLPLLHDYDAAFSSSRSCYSQSRHYADDTRTQGC